MERGWWWRFGLVGAVTLWCLWFLVPTYYSFFVLPKAERNNLQLLEQKLPKWAPSAKHRLNLGLDLQGGIHMVMRVDTRTALQKRVERRGVQMANYLTDKKLGEVTIIPASERPAADFARPCGSSSAWCSWTWSSCTSATPGSDTRLTITRKSWKRAAPAREISSSRAGPPWPRG